MKNIKIYKTIKRTKLVPFVIVGTLIGASVVAKKQFVSEPISSNPICSNNEEENNLTEVVDVIEIQTDKVVVTVPNDVEKQIDKVVNEVSSDVEKPTLKEFFADFENKMLAETIVINGGDLNSIKSAISYETVYDYSQYFDIEKALNHYQNYQSVSVASSKVLINNRVDTNRLYSTVLKNNFDYEKKKNYEQFSNEEIYEFCVLISNNLNDKISKYSLNLNDLDYILSNLKIMGYTSFTYATINDDNCLIVNKKMINSLGAGGVDKIIAHESMHLIQKTVDSDVVGINYSFSDLKVNPLYNKWFLEASAERMSLDVGEKETLYTGEINYLNALNVANINGVMKVEDFNFTKKTDDFYTLFMCDETISKKEIISMMYSINFITLEDKAFLDAHNIKMDAYEVRDLKYKYSSQVCETLSKKFYYDLGCMLQSGLKLQDVFSLIALFENVCSVQTFYDDWNRTDTNRTFINNYSLIQSCLFEVLASKLNVSVSEIYNLYSKYNSLKMIDISCTNKNDYLNAIYLRVRHKQTQPINSFSNNLINLRK